MSFDQSLISHKQNGIYAAAWLAGTSGTQALIKYYKKHDIDSINVPKLCDSLISTIQANSQNSQNDDKSTECSVPFRICSNLMIGSLKIYQQQVCSLLKQSEDLVVRSIKYNIKGTPTERNVSGGQKNFKKRRLNLTQSNDYIDLSKFNCSEILDDLETLTLETEVENEQNKKSSAKKSTKLRSTKFQIREITIRELNATYEFPELDDECGFGNATNDEILQFFSCPESFYEERSVPLGKKRTPKRKRNYEEEAHTDGCTQVSYEEEHNTFFHENTLEKESTYQTSALLKTPIHMHHASLEHPLGGNINMLSDSMATPIRKQCDYEEGPVAKQMRLSKDEDHAPFFKRTLLKRKSGYEENIPDKRNRLSSDHPFDLLRGYSCMETDHIATPCRMANKCLDDLSMETKNKSPVIKDEIKEEIDYGYETVQATPNYNDLQKFATKSTDDNETKHSNLIIDSCIKIEQQEMLDQLQKPPKELIGVTKGIFRKFKSKKTIAAKQLLKRFNKRTLLFCKKLKQKQQYATNMRDFQENFLNLLKDIFKSDYNGLLAKEIYPQWQTSHRKISKKNSNCSEEIIDQKAAPRDNILNENANMFIPNDIEDMACMEPNYPNGQSLQQKETFIDNEETPAAFDDWRPCGVMAKLLRIWQYSTDTKINANEFCHSAEKRMYKAVAFSSLLILSKSHFIFITEKFKTVEMDKLLVGSATESFLQFD
ncbi:uncharacterized protein LOC106084766 [Stomoxys calcitrans]|uniref:uncharacterized protein LOC106084766 n=1 Tax=Stomoxys calcitrans TaxID=35570 RepID=UPI0027E2BCC4|nr:uncharacterized protein LOC106084766 [Stomoxys calcitrans]